MNRGLFLVVALAVAGAGCGVITGLSGIEGSGDVIIESRDVSGFSDIIVVGSGEVEVRVTGIESLTVQADDNLMSLLTTEVVEGTLILGVEDDTSISPSRPILYKITAAEMDGVSVVGSAEFIVTGIDASSFGVDIAGSGDLVLVGNTETLAVDIRGSGDLDGSGLVGKRGAIDIAGSGDVVVNMADELSVTISGSGSVEYLGNPVIEQSISGSGDISQH